MHHWGASLHKSESPECGLVDCLIAKSVAFGLVPLDSALLVEFTAYDRVLLLIFDCPEVRGNAPPRSLAWPLCWFVLGLPPIEGGALVASPPTPVTLLWTSALPFGSTLLGISPCPHQGFDPLVVIALGVPSPPLGLRRSWWRGDLLSRGRIAR